MQRVGGQQGVFIDVAHGKVGGQSMKIDCRFDGACRLISILSKQAGEDAG